MTYGKTFVDQGNALSFGNPNDPSKICFPKFDFKNMPLSPSFPKDPMSTATNL